MGDVTYVVGFRPSGTNRTDDFAGVVYNNWLSAFSYYRSRNMIIPSQIFIAEFKGTVNKLGKKIRYLTGDQDAFHEYAEHMGLKYRKELTIKE